MQIMPVSLPVVLPLPKNYQMFEDAHLAERKKADMCSDICTHLKGVYPAALANFKNLKNLNQLEALGNYIQVCYTLNSDDVKQTKSKLEGRVAQLELDITDTKLNIFNPTQNAINAAHIINCTNPQDPAIQTAKLLIATASVLHDVFKFSVENLTTGKFFAGKQVVYNKLLSHGLECYQSLLNSLKGQVAASNQRQLQNMHGTLQKLSMQGRQPVHVGAMASYLGLNTNTNPSPFAGLPAIADFNDLTGLPDLAELPKMPSDAHFDPGMNFSFENI